MKLLQKIRSVLDKESKYPEENTGLLSLLRYVLVIWMAYYAVVAIYILALGYWKYALILGVTGFLFAYYTRLSYAIRLKWVLLFTIITTVAVSGYLTSIFGWRSSFQYSIYVAFLVLWYDPMTSVRIKFIFSTLMAFAVGAVSFLTPFGHTVMDTTTPGYVVLIYSNMAIFFVCISLVAFFFCTKYVETESKLMEYNRKLKLMSETDPLTKLMNRRFAEEEIARIEEECRAQGYIFCIAIGDIDFFKKVNDTYGHETGDVVLKRMAAMFKEHIKGHGFVARWGGEEFLFVLTRMNGDEALIYLDELRRKVKKTEFKHEEVDFKVTMTFGVEEYSPRHGTEKVIESADKKLYIGKQSGRDRVVF